MAKPLRRSYDRASGKAAIDRGSAWATASHINLRLTVVQVKRNEVTVVPKLLEIIQVRADSLDTNISQDLK